jgi:predicted alpha/beta superfamily hydrolase
MNLSPIVRIQLTSSFPSFQRILTALLCIFLLFFVTLAQSKSIFESIGASKYQVSQGTLRTINQFKSAYIAARDIHIWLPDNYTNEVKAGKKFSVLYMHDGQMLFDATQSWNKQEWGVDEISAELIAKQKTKNFIVVGINNGGKQLRHAEYFPQKPFAALTPLQQTTLYQDERAPGELLFGGFKVQSDDYLKFLVTELKPYVDNNFAVLTDKENTVVMGSSMGGLISLYAISEYPDVFGGAACLSTHWPGAFTFKDNPIPAVFFQYLQKNLPDPTSHKLYFDHGTKTLDAAYPNLQKQVDLIVKQQGYLPENWQSKVFINAAHDEVSWQRRLHIPIMFLLAR